MSVTQKINEVMRRICKVSNDAQTQQDSYLTEDKLTAVLHEIMAEVGLTFIPTGQEILSEGTYSTGGENGRLMRYACTRATFQVTDVDDDKSFAVVQAFGEGSDVGDKVLSKCMTMAYKYALLETFMIATENDAESNPAPNNSKRDRRGAGSASDTALCSSAQQDLIKKRSAGLQPEDVGAMIKAICGESKPVTKLARAQASQLIDKLSGK